MLLVFCLLRWCSRCLVAPSNCLCYGNCLYVRDCVDPTQGEKGCNGCRLSKLRLQASFACCQRVAGYWVCTCRWVDVSSVMWLTIADVVGVAPVWVAIATDQVGTDHAACVYLLQWCSRCLVAPVYCGIMVMANNRFAVHVIGLPASSGRASGYHSRS